MKTAWWLMLIVTAATSWATQTDPCFAPKLADDIVIDGRLDEPIWSETKSAGPFLNNRDGSEMPLATTAKIAYDDANVYVAVVCEESSIEKLNADFDPQNDTPYDIFGDDTVEIFIDPMASRKHFYQFILNPRGLGISGDGTDYEARLPFEAAGEVGDTEWTLEVRFPVAEIGSKPRFGDVWGIDVFRSRADKGDQLGGQYALFPTGMGYRVPGKFGRLIFDAFPGNPELLDEDRSDFGIFSWDPTFTVERRRSWEEIFAGEITRTAGSAPRWRADDLNSDAASARAARLAELLPVIRRSRAEFVTFPHNPTAREQILPWTVPARDEIERVIEVSGCRGEYEPATFGVFACSELEGVNLEIGDFKSADGKRLPSSIAEAHAVKCWYQEGMPLTTKSELVLVPELLLKNPGLIYVDPQTRTNEHKWQGKYPEDSPNLKDVDIAEFESQQYWLIFHIPRDTDSGVYTGRITVEASNTPSVSIPVRLTVHDFELAPSPMIHSLYYTLRFTGCETEEDFRARMAQMQAEILDQVAYGINMPTTYVNGGQLPWDDDPMAQVRAVIAMHAEAGIKNAPFVCVTYGIGGQQTEEQLDALRKNLRKFRKDVEAMGRSPVYVQGKDEASGETLRRERAAFAVAHEVGAKVFVATGNDYFPIIGDLLDMPVVSGNLVPSLPNKVHQLGYKILSYGNPQAGCENPKIYRQNYGLRLWRAGYDGAMNWEYCGGNWDEIGTDSNYREEGMVYRGKVKPIGTIQWEGWREGIDDIRYMATLLEIVEEAERTGRLSDQARKMRQWTDRLDVTRGDPDALRRDIVEKIYEMRELLGSSG